MITKLMQNVKYDSNISFNDSNIEIERKRNYSNSTSSLKQSMKLSPHKHQRYPMSAFKLSSKQQQKLCHLSLMRSASKCF